MSRQAQTPIDFDLTTRPDMGVLESSGFAGKVVPCGYVPLLPGDSASGKFGIDIWLAEMPRPLDVAVMANVQAWLVCKEAYPQFAGDDELRHAFAGVNIKALGAADRAPPPYFIEIQGASLTTAAGSEFFKTLGIHIPAGQTINSDLIDAFWLVYNFRLAAHSNKLTLKPYASQDIVSATTLPPAFWPSIKRAHMVPDYERALVLGSLDLDVLSGRLPVSGIGVGVGASAAPGVNSTVRQSDGTNPSYPNAMGAFLNTNAITVKVTGTTAATARADIFAEMTGQKVGMSLAELDIARTTQAFAKMHAAFAGNNTTGFDNQDALVALLMQGIPVDGQQRKRPILLDAKRVPVNFQERHATDAANLDDSVTTGRAGALLSLNVPDCPFGGVIVFTIEVVPERLDERMGDPWLHCKVADDLPNPLRDVQRVEPVDAVLNWRIDAKHAAPVAGYGWEPMNMKWHRDFTRLGGVYYQADPAAPFSEQRVGIWQHEIVNPAFTAHHFLCPANFPQDPFADPTKPAFHFVARHQLRIVGKTQVGDFLSENNDDYLDVVSEQV